MDNQNKKNSHHNFSKRQLMLKINEQIKEATLLHQKGQWSKAECIYTKVLQQDENNKYAIHFLGVIRSQQGDLETAARFIAKAIAIDPRYAEALNSLGNIFHQQGRLDEAALFYNEAITNKAEFAQAHNNLGTAYNDNGDFTQALECYRKAIAADSGYATAHYNLANVLHEMHRFEEAIESYHNAIAIDPLYESAHINLSISLLITQQFEQGWKECEWKFKKNEFDVFSGQDWDGSSLKEKSLLIYGTEGIGDDVMYAMFLPELCQQAKMITLLCEPRLCPLFSHSFPSLNVISKQPEMIALIKNNPFDFKIAASLLPRFFISGSQQNSSGFPKARAYLRPSSGKRNDLRTKYLDKVQGKKIIGLSWKSIAEKNGLQRSIQIEQLVGPLQKAFTQQLFFVSLQYGGVEDELQALYKKTGCKVFYDDEVNALHSLDDFTAQVAACDLVISIDNTTVHIAGALGIPVWTLLQFTPDWRWMVNRKDSYWYSSMQLYRQTKLRDWKGVVEDIVADLGSLTTGTK